MIVSAATATRNHLESQCIEDLRKPADLSCPSLTPPLEPSAFVYEGVTGPTLTSPGPRQHPLPQSARGPSHDSLRRAPFAVSSPPLSSAASARPAARSRVPFRSRLETYRPLRGASALLSR